MMKKKQREDANHLQDRLNNDILQKLKDKQKQLKQEEIKKQEQEEEQKRQERKQREKNKSFEELLNESNIDWKKFKS
ncbi:DUF3886 domain-containing protein [Bacillus sp. HMF5848]|uniref:DUF3886 domain-containing protein n=1 Tax=Bacillus sp. HMF5848 TaxID=2495421 RepID=UPI000F78E641|nr:DUF3886 domain-containing protein [Bacillus sp. HMF5848]RSK27727.1 DUF3886 domain-containing protein [Bacillus sp. HMF5848]